MRNELKYLLLGILLAIGIPVLAVQVSVPSSPNNATGYLLVSTSTGNYQATSTNPLYVSAITASSTSLASIFNKLTATAATSTNLFVGTPGGAGDASIVLGPTSNEWALGYDATDNKFHISSSTALGTADVLSISHSGLLTFTNASTTNAFSAVTICLTGDVCRTTWPAATNPGGSAGQLQYNTNGTSLSGVATTTLSAGPGISFIGTAGALVGGTALTISNVPNISYALQTATKFYQASTTATDNLTWNFGNGFVTQASSTVVGAFTVTGTTKLAASLTGLALTTAGTLSAYGGATCTNSFISALSASGVGTCTAPNPDVAYTLQTATKYYTASTTASDNLSWFFNNGLVAASSTFTGALALTSTLGIGTSSPFATFTLTRAQGAASSSALVYEYNFAKNGNIATSTAANIDCRTSNTIHWPIGASATTLTLVGLQPGTTCKVIVENPTTAAGALTWAAGAGYTLLWTGGTTPTQTTTANKMDVWSFIATQSASSTKTFILGAQTPNF